MAEIFFWNNLKKVMEDYAREFRNTYQDNLIKDGKISSGELLNNVEYQIDYDNTSISVSLQLKEYWKYVENGRAAGKFPPIDRILDWIKIKPVLPREGTNGRLPTEKQLAFLIARKIANEGIEPGYQLRNTAREVNDRFESLLQEAITADVREGATVIFSEFYYKS